MQFHWFTEKCCQNTIRKKCVKVYLVKRSSPVHLRRQQVKKNVIVQIVTSEIFHGSVFPCLSQLAIKKQKRKKKIEENFPLPGSSLKRHMAKTSDHDARLD